MKTEVTEQSLITELYREYDFEGRVYKIDDPVSLFSRVGGSTHRVVDANDIVHCVPAPGTNGCVLRWKAREGSKPVVF